jgi:hypothetical protein
MANLGKISRLPAEIRNEVCLRLHNGETSATILPWINALPETAHIVAEYFDGMPITPQNLSEWKSGEFNKWLSRREKISNLKELSRFAAKLSESGGNLASGSAAIIAGKILEIIDELNIDTSDPEKLAQLARAITSLQSGELAAQKLRNENIKLKHDADRLKIEKQKFRRETAELFIKWAADERAKEIALSGEEKSVKMDKLLKLMYGDVAE